jgi:hypothetical protein
MPATKSKSPKISIDPRPLTVPVKPVKVRLLQFTVLGIDTVTVPDAAVK